MEPAVGESSSAPVLRVIAGAYISVTELQSLKSTNVVIIIVYCSDDKNICAQHNNLDFITDMTTQ